MAKSANKSTSRQSDQERATAQNERTLEAESNLTPRDEVVIKDFIRRQIDVESKLPLADNAVITRFPPEPNGYLHIGHAKSICLNFGIAEEYGGQTYLRFDDTNPLAESAEYVQAIKGDLAWLGFDWGDRLTFASDYFATLHSCAVELIRKGKAYVCSLSQEEIRRTRGTFTEAGRDSPYRGRTAGENLDLFARMKAGEFPDGAHVLRARINMASPNLNMRDPVLYRIRHAAHQNVGDAWVIYPTYDFTHCICDALENITHSLCTLEFEDHRPLYDWVLDNVESALSRVAQGETLCKQEPSAKGAAPSHRKAKRPRQIEFSRLGLEHTVMSKRLLQRLVAAGLVEGWDDPRMPTLAGLRRRGVRPAAIRDLISRVGVTKQDHRVEMDLLDFCIRRDLENSTPRGLAVANPLPLRLTNYLDAGEDLQAPWHQRQPGMGARTLPFGPVLHIEREDFALAPPPKWRRLSPGAQVRLRYAYIIRCDKVVTDASGEVKELLCSYLPESKSGSDSSGVKPAGVIHWVADQAAQPAELRLYGRLLKTRGASADNFMENFNRESLTRVQGLVEPAVARSPESHFQFERVGYFHRDPKAADIYNRTVSLRDSWKPA